MSTKYGSALKAAKGGETLIDKGVYFLVSIIVIGFVIFLIELFVPGNAYIIPGYGEFYISHEFYRDNKMYFYIFGAAIGGLLARIPIMLHMRSVNKRVSRAARGAERG